MNDPPYFKVSLGATNACKVCRENEVGLRLHCKRHKDASGLALIIPFILYLTDAAAGNVFALYALWWKYNMAWGSCVDQLEGRWTTLIAKLTTNVHCPASWVQYGI